MSSDGHPTLKVIVKFRNFCIKELKEKHQKESKMSKLLIIKEFWEFIKVRKKWWLAPILFFLILLGAIIVLTEGSAIAPFIYTLF
jgi:hypothetical protein